MNAKFLGLDDCNYVECVKEFQQNIIKTLEADLRNEEDLYGEWNEG